MSGTSGPSSLLPGFLARSFLAKFLVALLLVMVVIGGVSATTYQDTNDQLTQETTREYVGVAEQSSSALQDWRAARADTVNRLSQFQVIRSGSQSDQQRFLESEASELPDDVYRVHLVDLNSATIIASTNRAKEGQTLNTREAPWQNDNLRYGDDQVFISSAEEVHLRSIVSFVSPVTTDAGGTVVLVMQTNLDAVAADLPTPGQGVFTQVVDSQGRVVAGTQETSDLQRNDGTLESYSDAGRDEVVIERGQDSQSGFLTGENVRNITKGESPMFRNADDEDTLVPHVAAYATVPNDDWVVVTHVPESTAFALRSTITERLAILTGTTFFGVALIGLVFGRGTVSALSRLTRKADQLESGNLDVDLVPQRVDEFGTLTQSFANMRDALRDRIEEAETARKEAEVSRSEALAMNEYLQERADEYSGVMRRCANGDLTQRMREDGENESMDTIAEEFNAMIAELEKTTGQLKTFSDEVAESSGVVLDNAEAVRGSTREVAASIGTIESNAADQQARLETVSTTLREIIASLEAVEDQPAVDIEDELAQFQRLADTLADASSASQTVHSTAESIADTVSEQGAELDEVSTRADRLRRYAKPLGDILDRFETSAEHEFVFSGGPSQTATDDD